MPKEGSNAETAGKPEKRKVHGVVYIHCGKKERAPITKEDFEVFMAKADNHIMEAVWLDNWDSTKNIRFP